MENESKIAKYAQVVKFYKVAVFRPCSDAESEILRAIKHPPKAWCPQGWPSDPKVHSFACTAEGDTIIGRPPKPLSAASFMGFSVWFVLI